MAIFDGIIYFFAIIGACATILNFKEIVLCLLYIPALLIAWIDYYLSRFRKDIEVKMKKLIALIPFLLIGCATPCVVVPMLNFGSVTFSTPGLKAFNSEGNTTATIRDPTEAETIKSTDKKETALQKEPIESADDSRLAELQAKQRAALRRLEQ